MLYEFIVENCGMFGVSESKNKYDQAEKGKNWSHQGNMQHNSHTKVISLHRYDYAECLLVYKFKST